MIIQPHMIKTLLLYTICSHDMSVMKRINKKPLFSCHLSSALFLTQKIAHMSFAHRYRQSYHITSTAIWAIDLSYGWKKITNLGWLNDVESQTKSWHLGFLGWFFQPTNWFINPINYRYITYKP